MNAPAQIVPPYKHTPLFPLGKDTTPYRKLSSEGVRVEKIMGRDMLVIEREAIRALSEAAFTDINHLLRPGHLKQVRSILDDKEASANDKFVANVMPRIPMRRFGEPSDFGGIAVYLMSKASSYHTADTFVIDGGYTAF